MWLLFLLPTVVICIFFLFSFSDWVSCGHKRVHRNADESEKEKPCKSIKWLVSNIIHLFELFAAASENVFLRRQVDYNAATPTSRSRVTICLIAGRQFGTGAEVSYGHFGTGAEVSGHFGPVSMVPKCLGSEVSRVRSVLTPCARHREVIVWLE